LAGCDGCPRRIAPVEKSGQILAIGALTQGREAFSLEEFVNPDLAQIDDRGDRSVVFN
jgi:hypothetical protein